MLLSFRSVDFNSNIKIDANWWTAVPVSHEISGADFDEIARVINIRVDGTRTMSFVANNQKIADARDVMVIGLPSPTLKVEYHCKDAKRYEIVISPCEEKWRQETMRDAIHVEYNTSGLRERTWRRVSRPLSKSV
jgi:hypothetical protein